MAEPNEHPTDLDEIKQLETPDRIRALLALAGGMTQAEAARRSELSRQTIQWWVGGRYDPSPESAAKFRDVIDAEIDEEVNLGHVLGY